VHVIDFMARDKAYIGAVEARSGIIFGELLCFFLAFGYVTCTVAGFNRCDTALQVSQKTTVDWFNYLREVCSSWVDSRAEEIGTVSCWCSGYIAHNASNKTTVSCANPGRGDFSRVDSKHCESRDG